MMFLVFLFRLWSKARNNLFSLVEHYIFFVIFASLFILDYNITVIKKQFHLHQVFSENYRSKQPTIAVNEIELIFYGIQTVARLDTSPADTSPTDSNPMDTSQLMDRSLIDISPTRHTPNRTIFYKYMS